MSRKLKVTQERVFLEVNNDKVYVVEFCGGQERKIDSMSIDQFANLRGYRLLAFLGKYDKKTKIGVFNVAAIEYNEMIERANKNLT